MVSDFLRWLRQLFHKKQDAPVAGPEQKEDRRVWTRYPSKMPTTIRPASSGAAVQPSVQAFVENISKGGIGLLVEHKFEPGELLSVELPGPEGSPSSQVLVCVVHVTTQPDGRWRMGCTFSRELHPDDLEVFGARKERATQDDNRVWVRYPVEQTVRWRFALDSADVGRDAQLLNLSANGAGLLVRENVIPGTLLNLDLQGTAGESKLTMLACVVRSGVSGDRWALGCNFISELSEAEVRALL